MKLKMILPVIVCVALAGCSAQAQAAALITESAAIAPFETEEPAPPASDLSDEETEVPSYEISSRSIQTEDGILIELTKPRLEIHPFSGTFFDLEFCYTGLSKGQLPESGEDYADPPYIKDLQFFRGEDETALDMAVIGTGRGEGTMDNGLLKICENQIYRFPSDAVAGQPEQIVVLVTFDELFGIPETMRYEINSVPLHSKMGQNPASKISNESANIPVFETAQTTQQPGEETNLPLYEVVSPDSIRAENGVLIEMYAASIEIHPVMGTLFRLGFRYTGITKDQISESRAEYADSPFITDLQLFRGEDGTPIRLDVLGGGGGQHQTDDGLLVFNQTQTYQFPSDMAVGQEEHIIVLVTFHEIFGITEPVRYELDLVPLQGPLG